MTEKELRAGSIFVFDSDKGKIEIYCGKNFYGEDGFKMSTNGENAKFVKQFATIKRRLDKLNIDYKKS